MNLLLPWKLLMFEYSWAWIKLLLLISCHSSLYCDMLLIFHWYAINFPFSCNFVNYLSIFYKKKKSRKKLMPSTWLYTLNPHAKYEMVKKKTPTNLEKHNCYIYIIMQYPFDKLDLFWWVLLHCFSKQCKSHLINCSSEASCITP